MLKIFGYSYFLVPADEKGLI